VRASRWPAGRPSGEATVVAVRPIETIATGTLLIDPRSERIVQAAGWSQANRCYLIDFLDGGGPDGCSWPGDRFVVIDIPADHHRRAGPHAGPRGGRQTGDHPNRRNSMKNLTPQQERLYDQVLTLSGQPGYSTDTRNVLIAQKAPAADKAAVAVKLGGPGAGAEFLRGAA